MASSLSLAENHILFTAEKDVQEIHLGQLGSHGISYFEYLRVYDNGQSVFLANNQHLLRYVFDKQIPIAAPIQQQFVKDNFHYFILPTGNYEQALHDIKSYFNLSHFMNLVERHPGYIDLYCFGADANNPGIVNFYLNKMDVLERFKLDFKEKSADLLKKAHKSKIALPDSMLPSYKGLPYNEKNQTQEPYSLSKKQTACLHYLLKGMSLKQIGKTLSLSPRTVEHYIEATKLKMNCHSRVDLFEKAMQLKNIRDKLVEN